MWDNPHTDENYDGNLTNDNKFSFDGVSRDYRYNSESWCEYQGDIGVEKGAGGFERSVDTPGSSNFRALGLTSVDVTRKKTSKRNTMSVIDDILKDGLTFARRFIAIIYILYLLAGS